MPSISNSECVAAGSHDAEAFATERFSAATSIHWYAAYICAHHEKRVASELTARAVEHFFPVYKSIRRWKDRRVTLELPLFPGYVFVRLALAEKLRVIQVPSVVRLVGFGGYPAALPDSELEILRVGLAPGSGAEPHPFLTIGRRVHIAAGPFSGLTGVLQRVKNRIRVVVSLELVQRSIVVDVAASDVYPVNEKDVREYENV